MGRMRLPGVLALVGPLLALSLAAPATAAGRGADGRFDKRRSTHFVLHQDVDIDRRSGRHGSAAFERALLDVLESAYDLLDDELDLRPSRRIHVLVYDPAIFDRTFGGLFRFSAAGFYQGVIRIRGDVQVSPRLARVLHHELVHAALDRAAPSLVLPAWLNEGLAEWFEARAVGKHGLSPGEADFLARAAHEGTLLPLAALSRPHFAHLAPNAAQLAYLQSYAMIDHLSRVRGSRGLGALIERVIRTGNLDRSLRHVARLGSDDLYGSTFGSFAAAR